MPKKNPEGEGFKPSRRVRVRVDFVYVASKPMEGIPRKLMPLASPKGVALFVSAGLHSLGISQGGITGGKWVIELLPSPKTKVRRKK